MTKDRAHMHLDTVFTMLDRDTVTMYPQVMDKVRAISLRPGTSEGKFHVTEEEGFLPAVADAMGVPKLQVVETGGDAYQQKREQWDDGNNVVALEPGWSSPTSATPTRSPRCARPASRSSPSRASSWARAAAAGTA